MAHELCAHSTRYCMLQAGICDTMIYIYICMHDDVHGKMYDRVHGPFDKYHRKAMHLLEMSSVF